MGNANETGTKYKFRLVGKNYTYWMYYLYGIAIWRVMLFAGIKDNTFK
jgi:hypothetical protein